MGLIVNRHNEDGTKRGIVYKNRIPGDATISEAIEGLILLIFLLCLVLF